MNKENNRYWIKFRRNGLLDKGHHRNCSFDEVTSWIEEKGILCIEFIKHDDKTPVGQNTKSIDGPEMLEILQWCERRKLSA